MIWFIVFNATFSNISAISWRSIVEVEETGVPERTTDQGQSTGKLYQLRLRVECTLFVIYKAGKLKCSATMHIVWRQWSCMVFVLLFGLHISLINGNIDYCESIVLVRTNVRGFYKMHWSLGSSIRAFKLYR